MLAHLQFIDSQIARSAGPTDADCWRLRRASCLAKLGYYQRAREEIAQVREAYAQRPDTRVSAMAHLADSHLLYFNNLSLDAIDRARRAHALSSAAGIRPVQALAAAWLALYFLATQKFALSIAHTKEALALATDREPEAIARASMVAALCLHFAGRPDLARPWYTSARENALKEHDETTTSAVIYNLTAMRVDSLRFSELNDSGVAEPTDLLLVGADSAMSYDAAIGSNSQDTFTPLLRAQVLASQGKWLEAAQLYRAHLAPSEAQGLRRLQCWYLANMAWCELNLGNEGVARAQIAQALECISDQTHLDDRSAVFARASAIMRALSDPDADKFAAEAKAGFDALRQTRSEVLAAMAGLSPL